MTAHQHTAYVRGCHRCEHDRDAQADAAITAPAVITVTADELEAMAFDIRGLIHIHDGAAYLTAGMLTYKAVLKGTS